MTIKTFNINTCLLYTSSQRERREYEKKREECEKIKAECEKIKRNLGRIIKHRSIELLKMTFPEIEQEKLASKMCIRDSCRIYHVKSGRFSIR